MRKPPVDIIVAGTMKGGTTAMYHVFKENPGFGVNRHKESNFFLREFDEKSLTEYDNSFLPGNLRVDVSPNYSKRHLYNVDIPSLIKRVNPDARVVFLARDPLKRIESHMQHNAFHDRIDHKRVNDAAYLEGYIQTSSYLYQITPFLENFRRDQILVLQQELMNDQPQEFLARLYKFLNVDGNTDMKSRGYNRDQKRVWTPYYDPVRKTFGTRFLTKVYSPFWYLVGLQPKPIHLADSTRNHIRTILKNDIAQFCDLFELDKDRWEYFFAP